MLSQCSLAAGRGCDPRGLEFREDDCKDCPARQLRPLCGVIWSARLTAIVAGSANGRANVTQSPPTNSISRIINSFQKTVVPAVNCLLATVVDFSLPSGWPVRNCCLSDWLAQVFHCSIAGLFEQLPARAAAKVGIRDHAKLLSPKSLME